MQNVMDWEKRKETDSPTTKGTQHQQATMRKPLLHAGNWNEDWNHGIIEVEGTPRVMRNENNERNRFDHFDSHMTPAGYPEKTSPPSTDLWLNPGWSQILNCPAIYLCSWCQEAESGWGKESCRPSPGRRWSWIKTGLLFCQDFVSLLGRYFSRPNSAGWHHLHR